MTTVEHPAAAVAEAALAELGMHSERAVDRGSVVAVQLGSDEHEIIVLVAQDGDGGWREPIGRTGTFRRSTPRADRTAEHRPLDALTRKRATLPGQGLDTDSQEWWAFSGLAATDAIGVRVSSAVDICEVAPDDEGRVFAAVRVQSGEVPSVTVTTDDGRTVPMPADYLGR